MKSTATSVDAYLDEVDPRWRATLERLRARCLELLVGCDEAMAYGMPTYGRGDQLELAFAAQVRYVSLYVTKHSVLDAHRAALAGRSVGKGCVRFTRPDQLDWDLVDELLRATAASTEEPC